MTTYKNLHGNSNVIAYVIGEDNIQVKFSSGPWYTYSYRIAGKSHVEIMKELAEQGYGLNSYIMRNVRFKYDR